jgi:hypothetical protein
MGAEDKNRGYSDWTDERKQITGDWTDHLLVKESNEAYGGYA